MAVRVALRPTLILLTLTIAVSVAGCAPATSATGTPTQGAVTATPTLPSVPPLPTASPALSPSIPAPTRAAGATPATPPAGATGTVQPAATPSATAPAVPSATPAPRFEGRIAYIEQGNVYVLDGVGPARRVTQTGDAASPRWIPKTNRLVYARGNGAATEIYAVNSDGSGEQRLTSNKEGDIEPRPSPDGTRIAWTRQHDANGDGRFDPSEPSEIWLMNVRGENQWRIVTGFDPAWSPDSRRIAYVTNGTYKAVAGARENNELRVIQSQGAEERILSGPGDMPDRVELQPGSVFAPNVTLLASPAWSFDGGNLAVTARGHTGLILVADSYRRGVRWIMANYEGGFGRSAYSPDGRLLATESLPASGWAGLKVRDLSSNQETSIGLPSTALEARQPDWSPDGRYLLFVGGAQGAPPSLHMWDSSTKAIAELAKALPGGGQSVPDWAP